MVLSLLLEQEKIRYKAWFNEEGERKAIMIIKRGVVIDEKEGTTYEARWPYKVVEVKT
jgi:hypothetical protein